MLRTDSLVLALGEPARSAFLAGIAELIDSRYDGKVTRAFVYEILTARRRPLAQVSGSPARV